MILGPARPFHGRPKCLCRWAPRVDLAGWRRREVHRQRAIRPLADRKYTASGGESNGSRHAILKEAVGRSESGVATEIDLNRRREPAETEISVRQFLPDDEPCIGNIRLPRDRRHPLV